MLAYLIELAGWLSGRGLGITGGTPPTRPGGAVSTPPGTGGTIIGGALGGSLRLAKLVIEHTCRLGLAIGIGLRNAVASIGVVERGLLRRLG